MKKIIYLNISWMNKYQGITNGDKPRGSSGYIKNNPEGKNPHDIYNFLKSDDEKCYGFAPIQPDIYKRFSASPSLQYIDGILVVWMAPNPDQTGRYIIGWYKDARLHRNKVNLYDHKGIPRTIDSGNDALYIAESKYVNCTLLSPDERDIKVKTAGQSSAYYGDDELNKKVIQKIEDYEKNMGKTHSKKPKNINQEQKQLVEKGAIEEAFRYYEDSGYEVISVEKDNYGWDLEATQNDRKLLIEVKGLSGEKLKVGLTPNEYAAFKKENDYILCIVTQAHLDSRKLYSFSRNRNGDWIDAENNCLEINEKMAAILTLK